MKVVQEVFDRTVADAEKFHDDCRARNARNAVERFRVAAEQVHEMDEGILFPQYSIFPEIEVCSGFT